MSDETDAVDVDLDDQDEGEVDLLEEQSFALLRPIEIGEERIERLEFNDPHAGQLKSTDRHKGEAAKMIALIARMTGLPIKAIDRLHPFDLRKAQRIVNLFFAESISEGGLED